MAFSKEFNKYILTQWPSPINGDLLNEDIREINYNKISLDILKPLKTKPTNLTFFEKNKFSHPDSLTSDTYYIQFKIIEESLEVFLNDKKLLLNEDYTYSNSFKRIRLSNLITNNDKNIGILFASYVPEDPKITFGLIDERFFQKYPVKIVKLSTNYLYEILINLRTGIENCWAFLKKTPPIWVGGILNQESGRDNLIKYKTPISNIHWAEILDELNFLNLFISENFSYNIVMNIPDRYEVNDILSDQEVLGMMEALNGLEKNLQNMYKSNNFNEFINPNGIFK